MSEKVIHAKQKQYYHDLFNNINRDSKTLYAEANMLLFRKEALLLCTIELYGS